MAVRDIVYLLPSIVLKSRIDHLHGSECQCAPAAPGDKLSVCFRRLLLCKLSSSSGSHSDDMREQSEDIE